MTNITEIVIPAIVFSSIVILVVLLLIYKYKVKKLFLITTQQSIQTKNSISPETIREIAFQTMKPTSDIKKGLLLLGVSIAIFTGSFIADFPDNGNMDLNDLINGIAAFPGVIGIVYLLLAKFDKE